MIFLAELNQLDTWATYISHGYLKANTSEKVYIIAGQKLGEKRGNTSLVYKELYGIRSSGARWHEELTDDLHYMDLSPCKAEPNLWMRQCEGLLEYITIYVGDLVFVVHDTNASINLLKEKIQIQAKRYR